MRKEKVRQRLAMLLVAALLGSGVDVPVAEAANATEPVVVEGSVEIIDLGEVYTFDDSGIIPEEESDSVSLKSGNYEKWIDRINVPGYGKTFYNTLVEGSDGDGEDDVLIDPVGQAESYIDTQSGTTYYVVKVADYSGSGNSKADMLNKIAAQQEKISGVIRAVYDAFDRDHPEVFWLSGSTSLISPYRYYTNNYQYTGTTYFILYTTGRDMRLTEYQTAEKIYDDITVRENDIETILAGCADKSKYERVRYFNEWLTKNNEYNTSISTASKTVWECISALDGREGSAGPVCEGYARAFKVLCDRSGIPCTLVNGNARNSKSSGGEGHMWNYAQLGGAWYGVDVTWNDPLGGKSGKTSGVESEKWLLLGSKTTVNDMEFLTSHPAENTVSSQGVAFTNGPQLSPEKYVYKSELTPTLKGSVSKGYDGTTKITNAEGLTLSFVDENGKTVTDAAVTAEYTFADANAGTSKEVVANITLTGDKYTLSTNTVYANVGTITAKALSSAMMTGLEDSYYFTNQEIQPAIIVKDGTTTLAEDTDYTVSYSNNFAVRSAGESDAPAVTVTGKGNYSGKVTKTFAITYLPTPVILYNGNAGKKDWYDADVVVTAAGYQIMEDLGDTAVDSITLSGTGEIVKKVYFVNAAGQITALQSISVTIDKDVPTFTGAGEGIQVSGKIWNTLLSGNVTSQFYKETKDVTILASNEKSSVDAYYYYLDTTGSKTYLTKTELKDKTFEEAYDGKISLNEEGSYVIYAYAVNHNGKKSDYICSEKIVLDMTNPVISDVIAPTRENNTLADIRATVHFTASEEGNYAWVVRKAEETEPEDSEYSYVNLLTADDKNQITITGLSAESSYVLYVKAVDKAGNQSDVMKVEFTTRKAMPVFDQNPTITGTYGQQVKDMILSQPESTNGIAGSWKILDDAGINDIPEVGTTKSYAVIFTPDSDDYADIKLWVMPDIQKKKPAVATFEKQNSYVYAEGSKGKVIRIDLAEQLPADCGEISYVITTTDSKSILSNVNIETDNLLCYQVKNSGAIGDTATITVTITTNNYEDMQYIVNIKLTDTEHTDVASSTEKTDSTQSVSTEKTDNTQANPTEKNATVPAKGKTIRDKSGVSYTVTKSGKTGGSVAYTAPKNKKVTSASVPATVTIDGITYKVTSIKANAFKNCKKLTKVTIGSNIQTIGKCAFYGCKKLKTITIKTTKLTKKNVGSKAFKGIHAKATIKVPKKKLSAYKKLLKARGIGSKVKVK